MVFWLKNLKTNKNPLFCFRFLLISYFDQANYSLLSSSNRVLKTPTLVFYCKIKAYLATFNLYRINDPIILKLKLNVIMNKVKISFSSSFVLEFSRFKYNFWRQIDRPQFFNRWSTNFASHHLHLERFSGLHCNRFHHSPRQDQTKVMNGTDKTFSSVFPYHSRALQNCKIVGCSNWLILIIEMWKCSTANRGRFWKEIFF